MHCRPGEGEGPEGPHEPGQPYEPGEPHEPGQPYEPGEPYKPYEPGAPQAPGEGASRACCLDSEVIEGISAECCRSLLGVPIENDHVARTHCEQGTPE